MALPPIKASAVPFVTPKPRRATWASKPAAHSDDMHIEIHRNNALIQPPRPLMMAAAPMMPPPSPHLTDDKLELAMKDLDNLQYELAGLQQRLTNTSIHHPDGQPAADVSNAELQLRELGLESPNSHMTHRLHYHQLHNQSLSPPPAIHMPINISVHSPQNNVFDSRDLALNQSASVGMKPDMMINTIDSAQGSAAHTPALTPQAAPAVTTIVPTTGATSPKRTRQQTRRGVTIFRVERSGRFIELQQPENPQEVWERKQAAIRASRHPTIRLDTNIADVQHASFGEQSISPAFSDSHSELLTNIVADAVTNNTGHSQHIRQLDVSGNDQMTADLARNASLRLPLRVAQFVDASTSPHPQNDPNSGRHSFAASPAPAQSPYYRSPVSDGAVSVSHNDSFIDDSAFDEDAGVVQDPFKTVPEDTLVAMNVDGLALDKIRSFISAFAKGTACPYLEFYRCVRNLKLAGNAVKKQVGKDHWWQPVHKTEVVYDTQNPQWAPFVIPAWTLCHNNYDRPVLIRVWDYSRSGYEPRPMGEVVTTLRELLNANIEGLNLTLNRVDRKNGKQDKNQCGALLFRTVGLCQQMTPEDAIKKLPSLPDTVPESDGKPMLDLNFTANPLVDRSYLPESFDDLRGENGLIDYSSVTLVRLICRATDMARQSLLHANAPWLRVYRPAGNSRAEQRTKRLTGTELRTDDQQWIEMHTTEVLKADSNDKPWRAFVLNLHALHKSMCKGAPTHRFDSINSPSGKAAVLNGTMATMTEYSNRGCICYDTPLRFVTYSGHYHSGTYIGETKLTLRRMFTSMATTEVEVNEYDDQTMNLNTVNVMGTATTKGRHQQLELDLINPTLKHKSHKSMMGTKYSKSGALSISGVTVYMPSDISHLISVIATSPPEADEAVFQPDAPPATVTSQASADDAANKSMSKSERRESRRASKRASKNAARDSLKASPASGNAQAVPVFAGKPTNVYQSRRATAVITEDDEDRFEVDIPDDVVVDNAKLLNLAIAMAVDHAEYAPEEQQHHSNDSLDNLDPDKWTDIPQSLPRKTSTRSRGHSRVGSGDKRLGVDTGSLRMSDPRTSFKYSDTGRSLASPHSGNDENAGIPADVMDMVDSIRNRNNTVSGQPIFGTLNRALSLQRERAGTTMSAYNYPPSSGASYDNTTGADDTFIRQPDFARTRSMTTGFRPATARNTLAHLPHLPLDAEMGGAMPLPSRRATMSTSTKRDKSRYSTLDRAAMAEWNSLMKKANNNKTMHGTMNVSQGKQHEHHHHPHTRTRADTMNDLKQFFNPNAEPETPAMAREARNKSGKMDANQINQIAHAYALKQLQGTN